MALYNFRLVSFMERCDDEMFGEEAGRRILCALRILTGRKTTAHMSFVLFQGLGVSQLAKSPIPSLRSLLHAT